MSCLQIIMMVKLTCLSVKPFEYQERAFTLIWLLTRSCKHDECGVVIISVFCTFSLRVETLGKNCFAIIPPSLFINCFSPNCLAWKFWMVEWMPHCAIREIWRLLLLCDGWEKTSLQQCKLKLLDVEMWKSPCKWIYF